MLDIVERIIPDVYSMIDEQYRLLALIAERGPIGRRALSKALGRSEASLRRAADQLKEQQLITIDNRGMTITTFGETILSELTTLLENWQTHSNREQRLAQKLGIERVLIVPGDVYDEPAAFDELGRKAARVISSLLDDSPHIIGVSGGSVLNKIAEQMPDYAADRQNWQFVAARGGLGDEASLEANTVAQHMAEKTNGEAKSLFAPGYVSPVLYEQLMAVPEIRSTLELVEKASLVLYSIGEPMEMAARRGLPAAVVEELKRQHVAAETFGEFLNDEGEIIYKSPSIGLQFKSLMNTPHVVIVSGGRHKVRAIRAHMKIAPSHAWLVTDEAAAQAILKG